jgi:hypothetical protein
LGVKLEEHRQKVIMGSEELLPASNSLQNFGMDGGIDILLVHEQAGDFDEELLA